MACKNLRKKLSKHWVSEFSVKGCSLSSTKIAVTDSSNLDLYTLYLFEHQKMADIQFGMIDTSTATDIVPEFGWITHFPFWALYKGLYGNIISWGTSMVATIYVDDNFEMLVTDSKY